jgi:hypothetical protein
MDEPPAASDGYTCDRPGTSVPIEVDQSTPPRENSPPMPRFHTSPTAIARLGVAATLAAGAALGSVGVVAAYPSPASTATITSTCSSVAPGGSCSITFTLVDGSNHPVSGAPVTFSLSGLSTGSVTVNGTTKSDGVASSTFTAAAAPTVGTDADCGKTGTITGTSGSATAQTQFTLTCPTGLLDGLLGNALQSLLTSLTGGILNGVFGGSTYSLTVPSGSLPAGTTIGFTGPTTADLAALNALLTPGTSLLASFGIQWPASVTASSPITLVIHDAAFHAGQHVDKLVNHVLVAYPNSTVGEGVVSITFSNDPVFAVVSPTTSVPGGLGNLGSGASNSHPTGLLAAAAGTLLLLTLVTVPALRRRQSA